LRYYFRYIASLPEETVSASLIFGSAIHLAIEHHYREQLAGNGIPNVERLLAEYQLGWEERTQEVVRFGKTEEVAGFAVLAQRLLTAFQAQAAAESVGQILAVEETLLGELIPGLPPILGRVDLITTQPDALVIHDWKTSRSRWTNEQVDDAAEQLLLYSELARDFAPGKPIKLVFTVLVKTKEARIEQHALTANPIQLARLKRVVARVWQAISTEQFYPAPSPQGCAVCPYRAPCRAWPG